MGRIARYGTVPGLDDEMNTLFRRIDHLSRKTKTVEARVMATETRIAHGLGRKPEDIHPVPRGDARLWQTRPADTQFVYLRASVAVMADVYVK